MSLCGLMHRLPPGPLLEGRKAIITGASQGLGYVIAREFLAQGAHVLCCARGRAELRDAQQTLATGVIGPEIEIQVADVSVTADVDRLFATAEDRLGSFDIVVNNAGVHGPIGYLDEVDPEDWLRAIHVNLLGTALVCRRAIRHFKDRGYGKIINLSGGGATAPQPGLSAYGASKAGLVRMTEALAHELALFRIDVNAVAPGALATRLMDELAAAGPEKIGEGYHQRVNELRAQGGMPLETAARLCVYLASASSDGLSGRLISAAWDPWPFDRAQIETIMASDIYTLRRIVPEDRGLDWMP